MTEDELKEILKEFSAGVLPEGGDEGTTRYYKYDYRTREVVFKLIEEVRWCYKYLSVTKEMLLENCSKNMAEMGVQRFHVSEDASPK